MRANSEVLGCDAVEVWLLLLLIVDGVEDGVAVSVDEMGAELFT